MPDTPQDLSLPHHDFSGIVDESTGRRRTKKPPRDDKILNVDHLASHLLSQRNPGTTNYTHGIIIDHLFRVDRSTVFAYGLSRILTDAKSSDHEARRRFTRAFASLTALPGLYREVAYSVGAGLTYQSGPDVIIHPVILERQDVFTLDINTVIQVLLDNRIDPPWIDHCYTYGYQMLTYLYGYNVVDREFLGQIDDERIQRLRNHGEPPVISEWAGWRWPSPEDYQRVTHQFYTAAAQGKPDPRRASEWREVGEPLTLPGIEGRAEDPSMELNLISVPELPRPPTHLYSIRLPDPINRLTTGRSSDTSRDSSESSEDEPVLIHSSSPLRLPGTGNGDDVSMTPRNHRALSLTIRRSRSESPTPRRNRAN
ncbi:hypothetical protein Agabi119p4_1065 [Agaricus bisporus var. burnettii]|uniref:Uncharacterized protein n=1 Tax=Agaricus bisporus var. burnettii TaxID=192524 RepID=A0A8H7KLB9_AGABI|nr:hypothetical protein Agabi119p4_1065 [Agaricus bisporus var. burnettii]